mmetsp:Transcript_14261/g.34381  ORF Transcript_14261/g.34381 Transcript_14261/m.34381 type:complete len:302 (-) Transcript_14261:77-982(-)
MAPSISLGLTMILMAVLCNTSFLTTAATFVAAFQTPERLRSRPSSLTVRMVLYDPLTNEEHAESLWVDFPTPQQRTLLKKEASKRRAGKTLPTYRMPSEMSVSLETLVQALEEAAMLEDEEDKIAEYYDPEEDDDDETENEKEKEKEEEDVDEDDDDMLMLYEDQTLDEIWQELRKHEVVQLKGVCSESRKYVYSVATWICAMLEERQEEQTAESSNENDDDDDDDASFMASPLPVALPVAVLDTKGHTCLLYSPTLPLDHEKKFLTLRTSVGQKNAWARREKAPRDHRGQIIDGWKRQKR